MGGGAQRADCGRSVDRYKVSESVMRWRYLPQLRANEIAALDDGVEERIELYFTEAWWQANYTPKKLG
jgi:hypothetical protein